MFSLQQFRQRSRQERRIESEQVEIIIVEESIQPQPQLIDRGLVPQLWQNYTGGLNYYIAAYLLVLVQVVNF